MVKFTDFINLKTPQCFVRFSHCEHNLLSKYNSKEEIRSVTRRIAKFSNIVPSISQIQQLAEDLKKCIQKATYIGGLYNGTTLSAFSNVSAESIDSRIVRERFAGLLEKEYKNRKYISCVTCRNVSPFFEDKDVDLKVYQIPSERKFRRFENGYEEPLHNEPIYPDAMERVRKEIVIREPGELFLVGAGIFGKILCVQIMEMGGFAFDVGSYMDAISKLMPKGRTWNPDGIYV